MLFRVGWWVFSIQWYVKADNCFFPLKTSQYISDDVLANERPVRPASKQPRAAPWVSIKRKRNALERAKAFIYLTMLLPFQGVYWRLTCTQCAALGCLLAGLTGRTITHLNRHRANNYSHSWVNYSPYSNSFPDKKHLQTIHWLFSNSR